MTVPSSPLAALLDSLTDPAFAVLDGAVFDDLSDLLAAYGLGAHPLLRDAPGGAVQREGPWLLAIGSDPKRRAALLTIMAEAPGRADVIWATDAGEEALYAHLRSLNQASLPSGERVFFSLRRSECYERGAAAARCGTGRAHARSGLGSHFR